MSEDNSSSLMHPGVGAVLAVMIAIGLFGLILVNPQLINFYLPFLFIVFVFAIKDAGEYGFTGSLGLGRSIYSTLDDSDEDELTESSKIAVVLGIVSVLVGIMVSAGLKVLFPGEVASFSQIFIPYTPGAIAEDNWLGNLFRSLYVNNIARVGLAICNMFFIGFSEEFIFRGPLLRTLIRGLNTHLGFPWWAAAVIGLTVSASFFALYHFQRYGTAYNNFYPFVVLMALGYVWGVLSFFFGTLSAGLGHSFWDILAMAAVGGW